MFHDKVGHDGSPLTLPDASHDVQHPATDAQIEAQKQAEVDALSNRLTALEKSKAKK
ncbi:MAG TPA: hypothetical protein VGG46_08955 [Terriglobales bacterium]|jgi:hypothetical protein